MALTMTVDGFDPSTIGVEITDASTRRVSPPRQWSTGRTPLRASRVLTATEPAHEERELVVEGRLKGTSTSNYETRRDELLARLDRDDEVEVSFSDTSRIFYARFTDLGVSHRSMGLAASDNVTMRFQLRRPWSYDASNSTVTGITTTDTDIPLGTAPTFDVTLRIDGAATDPTITYKDSSGNTVHTLSLTLTLGASDWVDLSMLDGTIVDNNGTSQQAARDTGTDFPFALDPRDGEHWNSAWPTLAVDSGTLKVTYRKAYF